MANEYGDYLSARIASARQASSRVLFVGYDTELLEQSLGSTGLDGLDCLFVSNLPQVVGRTIRNGGHEIRFQSLGTAEDFAPDLVLVMPAPGQNVAALYEMLLRMLDIPPGNVLLPQRCWFDRLAGRDETSDRLAAAIPGHIKGGVSSREITCHIHDCLTAIATGGIQGDIVNLGVYQGWSMYFMALAMENLGLTGRKLLGFDTFSGFVDTQNALDGYIHASAMGRQAYQDTLRPQVEDNLKRFPFIELVEGDIRETVAVLDGRPLALAFFDMDDYTPTAAAIDIIYDNLSPSGMMVHDHYAYHTLINGICTGQRLAVEEFLSRRPMFSLRGTNVMVKIDSK